MARTLQMLMIILSITSLTSCVQFSLPSQIGPSTETAVSLPPDVGIPVVVKKEMCADVVVSTSPHPHLEGILALEDFGTGDVRPVIKLIDLKTGETIPASIPATSGKLSPDGFWLMFGGHTIEPPVLLGQNGKILAAQDWQSDWVAVTWVDKEHLLVSQSKQNSNGHIIFDNTLMLFNPFTGETDKLLSNLPNIFSDYSPAPLDLPYYWVSYSPDMNLASYITDDGSTILLNLITKQVLWRGKGNLPYIGDWSPDGNQLAIPVWVNQTPELFLIQRDGAELRLTDVALLKNEDGTTPRIILVGWSPQGNYLLFTFDTLQNVFGLINIQTKEVSLYCILNINSIWDYVWSPDESHIALGIQDTNGWHTMLFDISTGILHYFANNSTAAGWIGAE